MLDLASEPQAREGSTEQGAIRDIPRRAALVQTLVPNSGIQFLDFTVDDEAVGRVRRRFFEDRGADPGDAPSLHVASVADGVFFHPVTNEPCDPARTYTVGGADALAAFAGCWLPVPFMRIAGRDGSGEIGLDEGPSNWVRAFVARATDRASWHVVLAVDTAIDQSSPRNYAGPTLDDVSSRAAYRFSDDVADVAWFATEAWVDDWLSGEFRAAWQRRAEHTGVTRTPGALEHLANYLTLLALLKEVCEPPALRFMEPNAVGAFGDTVAVDLAIDIGSERTSVLIEERHPATGPRSGDQTPHVSALPLRDLGEPWRLSSGAFESRIAFSRAGFGNEALSRWSGRPHAFRWPSIVRIGAEAGRLAREASSADAVTGVSSPLHYVWDESPSRHVWRFAGAIAEAGRRSPIVSGPILASLSETGDVIETRDSRGATTKPRFSRSALTSLFVAEVLLHAIGVTNSAAHRARRPRPALARRLDRILVTAPPGMHEAEQLVLRRRVEAGVRLLWRVMGWSGAKAPLQPPEPTVVMVADSATSTQVAWLRNEIVYKFRGKAESYLAVVGRNRAGFTGARTLRVATLDVGAALTGLSITTWELGSGGSLTGTRQLVDGFEIGGNDIVKAVGERFVLPAIEQRLIECRIVDARRFLSTVLSDDERGRPGWVGDLGRRVAGEIVAPAAAALLRLSEQGQPGTGDSAAELPIRALLASVGARGTVAAERLDILAADEGADGFSPLDTVVPFFHREIGECALAVLRPMLDSALRVIGAFDCDCILLTGGAARLPQVMEALLEAMPLRPDRIVPLADYRMAAWYPFADRVGRVGDGKPLAALGALLQSGQAFGHNGPELVLRPLDRSHARVFIGRLDDAGLLRTDAVMFDLDDAGGERTRTLFVEPPVRFGIRRPSLESWPAQALHVIELVERQGERRPKMPLRVVIEHVPHEHGHPAHLRLVAAHDGDGNRLDEEQVVLRLATRRFGDAHWLDGGRMKLGAIDGGDRA